MKILSWNCQGLGHPEAVPVLREFARTHKVDIFALFATLAGSGKVENVRCQLGFEGCFVVDCVGRSGGLCVLWRKAETCHLLSYGRNFIDMEITDGAVS